MHATVLSLFLKLLHYTLLLPKRRKALTRNFNGNTYPNLQHSQTITNVRAACGSKTKNDIVLRGWKWRRYIDWNHTWQSDDIKSYKDIQLTTGTTNEKLKAPLSRRPLSCAVIRHANIWTLLGRAMFTGQNTTGDITKSLLCALLGRGTFKFH